MEEQEKELTKKRHKNHDIIIEVHDIIIEVHYQCFGNTQTHMHAFYVCLVQSFLYVLKYEPDWLNNG